MALPPATRALLQAALADYRAGDWVSARPRLEEAVAGAAESDADAWALLAMVCHRLGDAEATDLAADRALVLNPRSLRGALAKADVLASRRADREANFYYSAFIRLAGAMASLPPDLAEGLARARAAQDRIASGIQGLIDAQLQAAGYAAGSSDRRFTHALDILAGRKQPYLQQPKALYYPELPNIQFYPREQFPWMDAVEAATDAMTAELNAILEDEAAFAPYLTTQPGLPSRPDYPLIDSMDWSSCFLWKDGAETANAVRCPQTMAALEHAPLCRVKGRSPQIMFSQLKAGAHIEPHTGFVNTRLVCHLPLIVPPDCHFRVGNETRSWERGKCWAFDDTIEHEARNASARTRVVLIFDIWRPELTEEERVLVSTLLEAIDAYSPQAAVWD
ncbi:aspartyl/asparaginyl beta-hydroxylase domain-containing protein [Brevundimonas sp.]|uniref:aspartyl/asparaginyl beta-hydroxylase domain-containing protein n=1 Tax=Brevundimonas sp. TaxID=1871086 RepID=UPI002D2DB229|nr:aspartyl/asparaginyl beta-hydroxylase domain-containing protein [Brevundimonas sp.]HYC75403.1 aspartyl/asparaginyl beta-hydroxylase domain-containing protein [Brevundimonas sp.]